MIIGNYRVQSGSGLDKQIKNNMNLCNLRLKAEKLGMRAYKTLMITEEELVYYIGLKNKLILADGKGGGMSAGIYQTPYTSREIEIQDEAIKKLESRFIEEKQHGKQ